MTEKILKPSLRERIAMFRMGIIGDLLTSELKVGELKAELLKRSKRRYRPPDSQTTRRYHYKTLQRWYYEAKADPRGGLLPKSKAKGHALKATPEQRELLLEMRLEHPTVSAELLLSEAIRNGVVQKGTLTVSSLRRLFQDANLPRISKKRAERKTDNQRRRWQAEKPGDLWHGDVCHLVMLDQQGRSRRVLVHGLLDDASRYCLTLDARLREREQDMLEVFCGALLRHPAPGTLYLDNGSCYRGDSLALLCKRLGINPVHAQPYSPEARGKMERFWRTMRQRCTDHLPPTTDGHGVAKAIWAWLDVDYHCRPHTGLLGETPRRCYIEGMPQLGAPLAPKQLASALEVTIHRMVRRDSTFELDGKTYEVNGRHLAGKRISIVVDALGGQPLQVIYQKHPVTFAPCDPLVNRYRHSAPEELKSQAKQTKSSDSVPFDPIVALLQKAREMKHE